MYTDRRESKVSIKRLPKGSPRGFTLVEITVAVAILGIVSSLALGTLVSGIRSKEWTDATIDIQNKGRELMEVLAGHVRTAYLSEASVSDTALAEAGPESGIPRFVGVNAEAFAGDFKDDDGDGRVDEERLDGIDNDGDGLIDEDIGTVPCDMLNFASMTYNQGDYDIIEMGFGLRLKKDARGEYTVPSDQLLIRYKTTDLRFLFPQNLPALTEEYASAPEQVVSTLQDEGVVGVDIRYFYYDWYWRGWHYVDEWNSAREGANLSRLVDGVSFGPTYNEEDDLLALSTLDLDWVDARATQRTDGLPQVVEITLYVKDRDGVDPIPTRMSLRVFLQHR